MDVSQIMGEAVTIDKDERLSHALETLGKKSVDRLVVIQNGEVRGILTYADIADRLGVSKVVALSIKRLHVSSAMTDTVISVSPDDEVTDVARLMVERGMSGCPVIDKDGALVGVITKTEIARLLEKFDNVKVGSLMTTGDILQVNPITRLIKARADMLDAGYSGLPVTDGGRVLGLLTERMVAEAMARFTVEVPDKHRANQVRQIRVVDAMLKQPPLVTPEDSLSEAVTKMLDANLNTLPVVGEGNRLVGMISSTDLARFVANKFKVPDATE
ncbi:MAG: HPP family protein [Candidatus Thorarchaeota archaeon]